MVTVYIVVGIGDDANGAGCVGISGGVVIYRDVVCVDGVDDVHDIAVDNVVCVGGDDVGVGDEYA